MNALNHQHIYNGSCHCGAVKFSVALSNGLGGFRRCDCSLCSRRGAVVADAPLDDLAIIEGIDELTLYQFHTMTAKHYFCKVCGIYTHHQRRSDPSQYAFNAACLDGVRVHELGEIPVEDGINHPNDQ